MAYPPSRQMAFRIGITIGYVVERDGDLLGDGVNIAARLEGESVLARNLIAGTLLITAGTASAEAPRQLFGKTIAIGWNEYRVQRCDDASRSEAYLVVVARLCQRERRLLARLSRHGARGGSNSNGLDPEGGNQQRVISGIDLQNTARRSYE